MGVLVTALANGFRVVSHQMPHLETASLGVWVNAGARSEALPQHGISHLLEHMAFKGTARRSAREIAEEIESAGGELNAATSHETTAYYARVLKGDVSLAVDIVADILRDPQFDSAELEREKDVILQEIAAAEDSPDDVAHDLAQDAAYPDQALGRAILGTPQSVSGFEPEDLTAYMLSNYTPGSMILAAAGAVEHGELVRLADEAFGDMAAETAPAPRPADYAGGYRSSSRPFEQSHLVLSFEGPSYHDDTMYAGQVLSSILGGGMSSRLFQEAREKRGLCYSIYAYSWCLSDTGLFGIHAATGSEQARELLEVMWTELEKFANEAASDDELARAKAQMKSGLLMSLESSGARAEQVARQTLAFGAPRSINELVDKVDGVDKESVRALASEIILSSRSSVSAVGVSASGKALEAFIDERAPRTVRAAE